MASARVGVTYKIVQLASFRAVEALQSAANATTPMPTGAGLSLEGFRLLVQEELAAMKLPDSVRAALTKTPMPSQKVGD